MRWRLLGAFLGLMMSIACGRGRQGTPTAAAPAPAPDGATAFRAAQEAVRQVQQLSFTTTSRTALGVFEQTIELDCDAPYFHARDTEDLTPAGVESRSSLTQGRALAHQEYEKLFIDGKSYSRHSAEFEHSAADPVDVAQPDWKVSLNSYEPSAECAAFREGSKIPFVPLADILKSNKIEYRRRHTADRTSCEEYAVTYPDLAYSDVMKKVDTGNGFTASYREEITKPVTSTVCLGEADHLPRQGTKNGVTFTYSYGPVARLDIQVK